MIIPETHTQYYGKIMCFSGDSFPMSHADSVMNHIVLYIILNLTKRPGSRHMLRLPILFKST